MLTLNDAADASRHRVVKLTLPDADGGRPAFGGSEKIQTSRHSIEPVLSPAHFHGRKGPRVRIAIAPVAPPDAHSYLDMIGLRLVLDGRARQWSAHWCYPSTGEEWKCPGLARGRRADHGFLKDMNEFTKMNDVYE
jgi:hypothetical protein